MSVSKEIMQEVAHLVRNRSANQALAQAQVQLPESLCASVRAQTLDWSLYSALVALQRTICPQVRG